MRISSWALGFVSLALSSALHAQGVQSQVQPMSWSAGGGTSVPFAFASPVDIKRGEVTGYTLGASIPYRFSVTGVIDNPRETGLVGRVYDTFTMTHLSQPYLGYAEVNCLGGPGAPCNSQVDVRNFQGGTLNFGENIAEPRRFNVNAPDAYSPPPGGLSGQLSVQSAFDNSNRPGFPNVLQPVIGNLTSYSQNTQATINFSMAQRPWTTTEVLADRVTPVISLTPQGQAYITVDITPRFGFTLTEAAALSGYDHFNWRQELQVVRTGMLGPVASQVVYAPGGSNLAQLDALWGRGLGLDPYLGCYYYLADPRCNNAINMTDFTPLYWDEFDSPRNFVPGATDYRWQRFQMGARFEDRPNLLRAGTEVDFITQLVGVNADGSFDVLSELPIANADDFTFRWRFLQTADYVNPNQPGGSAIGILQNIDPLLGGMGVITLLDANGNPITTPGNGGGTGGGTGGGNGGNTPPGEVPTASSLSLLLIGALAFGAATRRAGARRSTQRERRTPSD